MKKRIAQNKWTHEIYLQKIHEYNIPIEPLEEYVNSQTKIRHRCTKCKNELIISPNSIMHRIKNGLVICQECGGKSFRVGKNDLWTTNPDIAKMLANPEDGRKYTKSSTAKVDWCCPTCGTKINGKSIHNTVSNALICPLCSMGRSKGHKIVNAILEYCGIDYENEYSFDWSSGKRYDIYANNNCIIEVNGLQHYEECFILTLSNKTISEQIQNDLYKKELALKNGISYYIYVDARTSDLEYMLDGIKENNDLIEYIDKYGKIKFSDIDWKCVVALYKDHLIWRILDLYKAKTSIKDIMAMLKCSSVTIERYLHLLNDYGFCEYNGYSQLCRKVICTTTGEQFNSLTEASNKYGIKPIGIYRVCNNLYNRTTAGRLPDGTKLKWQYAS